MSFAVTSSFRSPRPATSGVRSNLKHAARRARTAGFTHARQELLAPLLPWKAGPVHFHCFPKFVKASRLHLRATTHLVAAPLLHCYMLLSARQPGANTAFFDHAQNRCFLALCALPRAAAGPLQRPLKSAPGATSTHASKTGAPPAGRTPLLGTIFRLGLLGVVGVGGPPARSLARCPRLLRQRTGKRACSNVTCDSLVDSRAGTKKTPLNWRLSLPDKRQLSARRPFAAPRERAVPPLPCTCPPCGR